MLRAALLSAFPAGGVFLISGLVSLFFPIDFSSAAAHGRIWYACTGL